MKFNFIIFIISFCISFKSIGQCNANNFSATVTNGTCLSNGIITVQIPGAVTCSGWSAILTYPNSVETSLAIPSNGGPINFTSLDTGLYQLRLFNGVTTINHPTPIQVGSSYIPFTMGISNTLPSCPSSANKYLPNGTFTINLTDGKGPFTYIVNGSISGRQEFSDTLRTHTFDSIANGESITYTVIDSIGNQIGCAISKTSTYKFGNQSNDPTFSGWFNRFYRDCDSGCNVWDLEFAVSARGVGRNFLINDTNSVRVSINSGNEFKPNFLRVFSPKYTSFGLIKVKELDTIKIKIEDHCKVYNRTLIVKPPSGNFRYEGTTTIADSCDFSLRARILPYNNATYIKFCDTNQLTTKKQDPITGLWNTISDSTYIFERISLKRINDSVKDAGKYRFIIQNKCFVDSIDKNLNPTIGLNRLSINEGASVLQGTSSIRISEIGPQFYPLTIKVTPTYPYTNPVIINPSEPYNLAGSYNINFPIIIRATNSFSNAKFIRGIGDLPLGEYQVEISDTCGNTKVDTINLTKPADYINPTVTVTQGCQNATIWHNNAGRNSNAAVWPTDLSGAELHRYDTNTNTIIPNSKIVQKSNNYQNIPSGEYAIKIRCPHFWRLGTGGAYATTNYSAAFQKLGCYPPIIIPVLVPTYKDIQATPSIYLCNDSSGTIKVKIVDGTPVYPMIYNIYDVNNLNIPIQSDTAYSPTSSISDSISYINIDTGKYVIQIISGYDSLIPNGCYTANLNIDLNYNSAIVTISTSDSTVCESNNMVQLGVPVSKTDWHITWKDILGNTLAIDTNLIQITPNITSSYIVDLLLRNGVGCSSPISIIDTITIDVLALPDTLNKNLIGDTICLGSNAIVTIVNADSGTIYELFYNNDTLNPRIIDTAIQNGNLALNISASQITNIGINTFQIKASNYLCNQSQLDTIVEILVYDSTSLSIVCAPKTIYINGNIALLDTSNLISSIIQYSPLDTIWYSGNNHFNCNSIDSNNTVKIYGQDYCNNLDSCQSIITIEDTTKPQINCLSDTSFTINKTNCYYTIEDYISFIAYSDNCSDSNNILITQDPVVGTNIYIDQSPTTIPIRITATDNEGNSQICSFNLNINCKPKLIIPEFISPNGDNLNDSWVIQGLERYPNTSAKIYNRWGALVYENDKYDNSWNGTSSLGNIIIGKNSNLPSGVYYYILDINIDNIKPYTGYIQILE